MYFHFLAPPEARPEGFLEIPFCNGPPTAHQGAGVSRRLDDFAKLIVSVLVAVSLSGADAPLAVPFSQPNVGGMGPWPSQRRDGCVHLWHPIDSPGGSGINRGSLHAKPMTDGAESRRPQIITPRRPMTMLVLHEMSGRRRGSLSWTASGITKSEDGILPVPHNL